MRNLVQYPITKEEILDCLKRFAEEVDPNKTRTCGDMRPLLLAEAIQCIDFAYGNYINYKIWKETSGLV